MLMLLYPLEGEIDGYPRDAVPRRPVRRGREGHPPVLRRGRGARIDRLHRGPPGQQERLAQPLDRQEHAPGVHRPQQPRARPLLRPRSARNIGIHTCPGGDCDSVHSKEVPYEKLLEHMFDLNAGYFLIQCASEDDKEKVYRLCGQYSREDANGVPQTCFIGRHRPADARGRDARAGARRAAGRGQVHPGRAPRRDRRLRLLAVQPRRQAQARLAGLRARRGDAEDRGAAGGRARWPPRSSASRPAGSSQLDLRDAIDPDGVPAGSPCDPL